MKWVILVASILNLFLGILVLSRNPKRLLNKYFSVFGFVTSLWVFNNFVFRIFPDNLFFIRNAYAMGALVPVMALLWIYLICDYKILVRQQVFPITFAVIFFILSHVDGFIVHSITELTFAGFRGKMGPLFWLYSIYIFSVLGFILYKLYATFFKSTGVRKSQLKLIISGITIWICIAVSVSFILPLLGNINWTSFDSPSAFFFLAFTSYAIVKYRFLDIRAIIFRSVAFGIIIFIITGIYSVVSVVITYLFSELTGFQSSVISGVIIAIFVSAFYKPLRELIERATNTFLYKRSYDPDALIAKINQIASATLDFNLLLKQICQTLAGTFSAEKIGVALLNKKGKLAITYEDGFKKGVAARLAAGKERVMREQFKRTPGIFVVDERKTEYENGENTHLIASPPVLYALAAQDLAVIVPLRVQDKLIGVLAIGAKKSGEPYGSQDLRVLNLTAGPFAVAVENASLYEEQKHFAEILKDEVRKATVELRNANTELKHLDASKSEFISIASHQLRTPLTIIKGFISMINEQAFGKVPTLIGKQLFKVYDANERLIKLVEDLLNISRIESGRQEYTWQPTDLFKIAATVVENLSQNAEKKGLKLKLERPAQPIPKVVADEGKLHEVMINFVDNAIKYTPAGEILVRLSPQPEGMVTFSVKDSGMGISKETMDHLFQKFSRGKGSLTHTEGTGLGLYVAKMIVQVHEGKIWAESPGEGKGSTFVFSIPIAGPKVRPQPVSRAVKIKTPEQLAEQARR